MRLILVRHGESASNRRGAAGANVDACGAEQHWILAEMAGEPNGDTELTENGEQQVEALGRCRQPRARESFHLEHSIQYQRVQITPITRPIWLTITIIAQVLGPDPAQRGGGWPATGGLLANAPQPAGGVSMGGRPHRARLSSLTCPDGRAGRRPRRCCASSPGDAL